MDIAIPTPQTTTETTQEPVSLQLTAPQAQGLLAALATAGLAIPTGVTQIRVTMNPDGSANMFLAFQ